MSAPWLSHSLFRFFSAGTRPAKGNRPPCNARRRLPPARPRLEVELLEGRLCPSSTALNITDPSQLPLARRGVGYYGTGGYNVPVGHAHHHSLSVSGPFWNWQKLLMMNALQGHIKGGANDPYPWLAPGYSNLAPGWDDFYFHSQHNTDPFTFQDGSFDGKTLTGHEVNYYFQGMVAAAYGLNEAELQAIVVSYYLAAHHQLPSGNVMTAATQGFENYQADLKSWQQQTQGGAKDLPPEPPLPSQNP
jgi:hypothetical protein